MGLVVHVVVLLPLPGENLIEELLGHLGSEVIFQSVAVHQCRVVLLGCLHLQSSTSATKVLSKVTHLLFEDPDMILHQEFLVSLARL